MIIFRFIAAFLSVILLTGCASIVNKSKFPVTITSEPSGASVTVEDEDGIEVFSGITPATVKLDAGEAYFHAKSYRINLEKSGYRPYSEIVRAELSGWYIGNGLFGGLIGWIIVDPLTGKMWKLPKDVKVELSQ